MQHNSVYDQEGRYCAALLMELNYCKGSIMKFEDFDYSDYLNAFFFLRKKDATQIVKEHKQDRYEVCALHPDNAKSHYRMLSTYVMPCDELIDWIRKTKYRVVSIRKLRKQTNNSGEMK